VLTVLLRLRVRDVHQPLVTFVEVALCECDAHGQNCTVAEFTTAGPASRMRVPFLVYLMMLRERRGRQSRYQQTGDEKSREEHCADITREADDRKVLFVADKQEGATFIDRSCAMVLGLFKVREPWLQELRSLYVSSLFL